MRLRAPVKDIHVPPRHALYVVVYDIPPPPSRQYRRGPGYGETSHTAGWPSAVCSLTPAAGCVSLQGKLQCNKPNSWLKLTVVGGVI